MKKYTITVNGTAYEVEVEDMGGAAATAPKAAAPAPAQNLLLLALQPFLLLCLVKFSK